RQRRRRGCEPRSAVYMDHARQGSSSVPTVQAPQKGSGITAPVRHFARLDEPMHLVVRRRYVQFGFDSTFGAEGIDCLAASFEREVVVDYYDAARNDLVVELFEREQRRVVEIAVESKYRDRTNFID